MLDVLAGDPEAEELPLEDGFVEHDKTFDDQDICAARPWRFTVARQRRQAGR